MPGNLLIQTRRFDSQHIAAPSNEDRRGQMEDSLICRATRRDATKKDGTSEKEPHGGISRPFWLYLACSRSPRA